MQDPVGGDYNRTPVISQGADIYLFVGAIPLFEDSLNLQIFNNLIKKYPNWDFCKDRNCMKRA